MKPTIVHFINDLGRGGAETSLVSVINELKEFRNIVVTVNDKNEFGDELTCDGYYSLGLSNTLSLTVIPRAAIRFKRLIRQLKPNLIHSQLTIADSIARLATPRSIPLLNTIQTSPKNSNDYKKWYFRSLDKITYSIRPATIIGCSQSSLDEYLALMKGVRKDSTTIYNFVNLNLFTPKSDFSIDGKFKLVCVGNLKFQKNLFFMVEALSRIASEGIELHIYGGGWQHDQLMDAIKKTNSPTILHGVVNNVNELLNQYDLYVMSSFWEGLSLSVNEAMASRLPLLLSDIPSFREQGGDAALYFDLENPQDFVEKVQFLKNHENERRRLAEKAYERVKNKFTIEQHLKLLKELYWAKLNSK